MLKNRLNAMRSLVANLSWEGQSSRSECVNELISEIESMNSKIERWKITLEFYRNIEIIPLYIKAELIEEMRKILEEEEIRDTLERPVDWQEVANAFERINRKLNPKFYEKHSNFLTEVYNDNLPRAIKDMMADLFVLNYDQDDLDAIILKKAQKQLDKDGFIKKI